MSLNLLKSMIPYMERFESEYSNPDKEADFDDFMHWMNRKTENLSTTDFNSPSMPLQGDPNAQITQLLSLMHKYLRFYLKKAFEGTALSGPDDFGFLATLFMEGSLRKNELIDKNTMEFSSGMEVIKRLERNLFIESLPDEDDKRAKLVKITDYGRAVFLGLLPVMGQIGHIASACLSETEKAVLLELLNRLNHFHNPIFHQAKKESVDEILDNFMKGKI